MGRQSITGHRAHTFANPGAISSRQCVEEIVLVFIDPVMDDNGSWCTLGMKINDIIMIFTNTGNVRIAVR